MKQTILTITGSDGTGGSGVQADIRLLSSLGATAASVITSITVQNTLGIQEFHDLPASVVRQQVEAIINDLQPQIVKIGLLRRIDVVEMLAEVLQRYQPRHIIYAPVLTSTKGEMLVEPRVYEAIERLLIPLCTVVLAPTDLPDGPRRRVDLAVDIGNVDRVGIDEQEMSDTCAAERLGSERADAADPEDGDPSFRELCKAVLAQEKFCP